MLSFGLCTSATVRESNDIASSASRLPSQTVPGGELTPGGREGLGCDMARADASDGEGPTTARPTTVRTGLLEALR